MKLTGKHSRSKVGFADLYLERYGSGSAQVLPEPDPDLFLIVTIPAYKEPDLVSSISSLLACDPPGIKWEILININYPEHSSGEVVKLSQESLDAVQKLRAGLQRTDVGIFGLWNPDMPVRSAGVGLARKIAMDQAVRRFNSIGCKEGLILAFDADSTCDPGYLKTIVEFYGRHPGARTANIYFEHPLSGSLQPRIYESIAQYELYLRYMRLALEQTGHPHSIHTVGSSFSVRAKTYIRVNGMGRDKAGEDFYFLHKCIHLKGFWEINEAVVFPSVRESDRVTFGTGASMQRQMQSEESLEVYRLVSFDALKKLFQLAGNWWREYKATGHISRDWEMVSEGLTRFLVMQKAEIKIQEMLDHSASERTFLDKFFAWFNGFMVLRYLNEVHKTHFTKEPVMTEALELAVLLGIRPAESVEEMLWGYRDFERNRGTRKII